MTFPARGTRKLTVDGRVFLFHIAPRDAEKGLRPATIAAQEGSGVLHYWPAEVTPLPREAAEVIRFALANGWEPRPHGPTVWVGRKDGRLFLSSERLRPPWDGG